MKFRPYALAATLFLVPLTNCTRQDSSGLLPISAYIDGKYSVPSNPGEKYQLKTNFRSTAKFDSEIGKYVCEQSLSNGKESEVPVGVEWEAFDYEDMIYLPPGKEIKKTVQSTKQPVVSRLEAVFALYIHGKTGTPEKFIDQPLFYYVCPQ